MWTSNRAINRGSVFAWTAAPTWRSCRKRSRFPGDVRRRAGEKTSGEEETNGNNKAGDGGESKHAEIAHIQEMKSSRSPGGGAYCLGGVSSGRNVWFKSSCSGAAADHNHIKVFTFWWREAREQTPDIYYPPREEVTWQFIWFLTEEQEKLWRDLYEFFSGDADKQPQNRWLNFLMSWIPGEPWPLITQKSKAKVLWW